MPLSAIKNAYDETLLDNTATLVQIETALRNVTWFLPGRFQDAEVASEGVYSALSLVSLYHDSILSKRLDQLRRLPSSPFARPSGSRVENSDITADVTVSGEDGIPRPEVLLSTEPAFPTDPLANPPTFPDHPPDQDPLQGDAGLPLPSEHARYTRYFAGKSVTYKTASRALVVIGYVQLLLEMVTVRRSGSSGPGREEGRWKRWRLLVWLEAVKSALKLSLLMITKRPVLSFPLPQREVDPSVIAQAAASESDSSQSADAPKDSPQRIPSAVPRIISAFPLGSPAHNHLPPLLPRLPEAYQDNPADLLPRLEGAREWLGESMVATEGLVSVLVYYYLASRNRKQPGGAATGTGMQTLARASRWTSIVPLAWILVARLLRRNKSSSSSSGIPSLAAAFMPSLAPPSKKPFTPLLAQTYAARDRALLFYFLKGALWQRYTRVKVMRFMGLLEKIWGVRLVAGILRDHVELVDEYYYYTSS
ncbi:hypothetical protein QFC22_000067 [Naganishia vaughanmartiniae]|uniref:Uncharacterized protein n=1 Tax=Naganishia vaughanmartiniae TaxID=1424756 RepID=A0ACC2XP15_9TREE|nr:hypothetical protein QFC22_000067 [Naganishia vaughanmartiniae]